MSKIVILFGSLILLGFFASMGFELQSAANNAADELCANGHHDYCSMKLQFGPFSYKYYPK